MYLTEIPESYQTDYLAWWMLMVINQWNITFYSFWQQITLMQRARNHDLMEIWGFW